MFKKQFDLGPFNSFLMPGKSMGDAAHLALASYYKCDLSCNMELQKHCKCEQI